MTLTQYFIGAWGTAVLCALLVTAALADGELQREHGKNPIFVMAVIVVFVSAMTWPVSWLVFCGAMIRRAVLR